jgi:FixJ family two-component response regulator
LLCGGLLSLTPNLISIVDDDESVRRTTKLLVESFGYRAADFESAEIFLRSSQLHDTCCLVLDAQMPDMNGLQLQRHLTSEGWSIPIIFITAYGNKEAQSQAMLAGAVAFLDKPFSDEQLLASILSALEREKDGTRQHDIESRRLMCGQSETSVDNVRVRVDTDANS